MIRYLSNVLRFGVEARLVSQLRSVQDMVVLAAPVPYSLRHQLHAILRTTASDQSFQSFLHAAKPHRNLLDFSISVSSQFRVNEDSTKRSSIAFARASANSRFPTPDDDDRRSVFRLAIKLMIVSGLPMEESSLEFSSKPFHA